MTWNGVWRFINSRIASVRFSVLVLSLFAGCAYAQQDNPFSYVLENNSWEQLVIPGDPESQTIAALFDDDLDVEDYGRTWIIYTFDNAAREYIDPGVNGILDEGVGFWINQITGAAVEIDVPNTIAEPTLVQDAACISAAGCAEVAVGVRDASTTFTMLGAPFPNSTDATEIRAKTAPPNSVCASGCNFAETAAFGVLQSNIWRYDSATNTYNDMLATDILGSMESVWVQSLPGVDFSQINLLIPSTDGDRIDTPPLATFTSARQVINVSESVSLRWQSVRAEQVSIQPEIGDVSNSGVITIRPDDTITYTLSATKGDLTTTIPLTITVRPLASVAIRASVTEGKSPLTVRFSPVLDSTTAINRIYWDFEGDGGIIDGGLGTEEQNGFDFTPDLRQFDARGRDYNYVFERSGIYTTRARVWDVDGNQSNATITITVENGSPEVSFGAAPTYGGVPLRVNFLATAIDADGIAEYQWDFDGDGDIDEATRSRSTNHIYTEIGSFTPSLTVSDPLGATNSFSSPAFEVTTVEGTVPLVTLFTNQASGPSPLAIIVSAQVISSAGIDRFEWDFDSDGVIDETTSGNFSNIVNHVYTEDGAYLLTVSVFDTNGGVGRATFTYTVGESFALEVENSAMNPIDGETATISIRNQTASQIGLHIVEANNERVRTIADNQTVQDGTTSFNWDGRNDTGQILPPGDYYAIANVVVDGQEVVYDLRDTTAGLIFYPPAADFGACRVADAGIDDCGTLSISENNLEPFNNLPIDYDFEIPQNAKVTAYVTVQGNEIFAPATFFRSKALAAGDYNVRWFADGTDGMLLPDRPGGRGYVPAIYGLTAGENSIFLTHATTLENLRVEPPIFHPDLIPGRGGSRITFDLSSNANVLLKVDSVDAGVEILSKIFVDVSPNNVSDVQWDGRDNNGDLVAPGAYRISVTAQDEFGKESFTRRAMQRVRY